MRDGAIPISSTFGGEAVALASAEAVIRVYRNEDVCGTIETTGTRLQGALLAALPDPFIVDGMPWKPRVKHPDRRELYRWVQNMARRGHLIHPLGVFVCYEHTTQQVDWLADAAREAAESSEPLVGEPPTPPFQLRT